MVVLTVILGLLFLSAMYVIRNLLKKVEMYEDFCSSMLDETQRILQEITKIDIKKSFETDDEVGIIYTGIRGMVLRLQQFVGMGE